MNHRITFSLVTCIIMLQFSMFAYLKVDTFEIKKGKPKDSFFEGKVVSPRSEIFGFDVSGKLLNIKRPGDYVCSVIYNENREIVRKGTVIAELDKRPFKRNLDIQRMNVEIDESDYNAAKSNLERVQKLKKLKAISDREYDKYYTEYVKAKLSLSQSQIELKKIESQLRACDLVAPFSGIIEDVYFAPGSWVSSGDKVSKISRINPMIVEITLPRELVKKFSIENAVNIYPSFSDNAVPSWLDKSLIEGKIYAFVSNSLIFDTSTGKDLEKLSKVFQIFPVTRITSETEELMGIENIDNPFGQNLPLSVPVQSIKTDEKGSYVMRLKDVKGLILGKGIPNEFIVEKVYIKPGDIIRNYYLGKGYTLFIKSISEPSDLTLGDVVVLASKPDRLSDGEKAVYGKYIWRFYPGETVKVDIPSLTPDAFYMPKEGVVDKGLSEKYIYLIRDGKVKIEKVSMIGLYGNFIAVENPTLKNGEHVILMKNKDDYKKLFDGCPVTINKEVNLFF